MPSPASTFVRPSDQAIAYTEERRRYWEEYAGSASRWAGIRGYYQRRLAEIYKLSVPQGMRVLELGCGDGELLAKLEPAYGLGIDLSSQQISRAPL
jgi:SAM-dependent methyltransferase